MNYRQTFVLSAAVCAALSACRSLPETFDPQDLKWVAYYDAQGRRVLPVERPVGEKRTQAWANWLQQHRGIWRTGADQSVSGATLWCVQWRQNGQNEQICRRGGQSLVWFGYGVADDAAAARGADKIWIGR